MKWTEFLQNLLAAGIARGTPLLFAALGEMLAELSGVLNLGLEGIMLASAMTGVAAAHLAGSAWVGLLAAVVVGALFGVLHAFLTVTLRCDQVVTGLSLVFLGTGISSVGGAPLVGLRQAAPHFAQLPIPGLCDLPFLGPVLFSHPWPVYLGFAAVPLVYFFLAHTRAGLNLRAAGETPAAAAAMGIPVARVRYLYVTLGAAGSGLAGATLSLAVTPGWVDGLTAGQGWIAIGLVIVGGWRPLPAALGAWLFGAIHRLTLDLQGTAIPFFQDPNTGFFLNMLPYLAAVAVLVAASLGRRSGTAPSTLGRPFVPGTTR
ncbi:MAG: ABC transporter permease [Deltaproteobacteria bacterium]|nr:ABC transporter permease [Deltaproteobacteria bacterium]